ncbi:hypothetical protein Mapa_005966 [Marchantia paleacea]|nr:hypothetical protein Mapa_005966 [Marchantia paleacea]
MKSCIPVYGALPPPIQHPSLLLALSCGRCTDRRRTILEEFEFELELEFDGVKTLGRWSSFFLGRGLGDLGARRVLLLDRLDHPDRHRLSHVADCEATQRRVLSERLDRHGLGGDHLHEPGVAILQELGLLLELLPGSAVDLGENLCEFHSDVGSVAVQHGGIAVSNLTRVVHDDHLRREIRCLLGGIVFGIRSHEPALQVLYRHILHIKPHIVPWECLRESLVVHLDGFHLRGQSGGSEADQHAGLDDSSLDPPHGDSSNSSDFVDILEGKP